MLNKFQGQSSAEGGGGEVRQLSAILFQKFTQFFRAVVFIKSQNQRGIQKQGKHQNRTHLDRQPSTVAAQYGTVVPGTSKLAQRRIQPTIQWLTARVERLFQSRHVSLSSRPPHPQPALPSWPQRYPLYQSLQYDGTEHQLGDSTYSL